METVAVEEQIVNQITPVEPTVTAAPKPATAQSMFDQIIQLMADMIAKQIKPELESMVDKKIETYLEDFDFTDVIQGPFDHFMRYRFELSDHVDIDDAVSDALNNIDFSEYIDVEDAVSEILSNKISEIRFEVTASL